MLLFLPIAGLPAIPGQLLPKPENTPTQQTETPQAAQPPAPSAAPVVEPIPLSDVAKRLESSRRQIRDVGEKVQAPEVAEIAKEIEATRSTFAEETKSADSAIAKSPRPEELSDLEAAWKNRAARLAKWQQVISRWTSQLYRDFTLVDQEEQTWELTLKASPPGSLPREVERAVRDLLREIKKVKAEARKRLDSALVLENQLYQRETTISEVLNAVALGRERFQESLMVAERVPLWEVMTEWQRMGPAAGEIGALLSRQLADAFEFLRTHLLGLGLTVCLFFFILIVASLLSRKVAQWTQDHPHFEAATHFLKRPVSLALLITLVLSLVFFTDQCSAAGQGFGGLAAVDSGASVAPAPDPPGGPAGSLHRCRFLHLRQRAEFVPCGSARGSACFSRSRYRGLHRFDLAVEARSGETVIH